MTRTFLYTLYMHRKKGQLQVSIAFLGLDTHLFVKVPRPGDRKVTFSLFESSCYLLLPI